jgi:hypothetical protein
MIVKELPPVTNLLQNLLNPTYFLYNIRDIYWSLYASTKDTYYVTGLRRMMNVDSLMVSTDGEVLMYPEWPSV